MRPLRVFLCHASQDKPAVWKLHRYLKQRGVQPWLDQADLLPGQNWEVEIPKALFASDVILVCISKNSVNKEGYVQKEIVFALDKAMEKPEGTIFVIPVKLEECEIPRRLSMYHWVDYYRTDGRKRLLMGLNKRATELGEEVSPVILEDTRKRPVSSPSDQVERESFERTLREKWEQERKEKEEQGKAELIARANLEREAASKKLLEFREEEKTEEMGRVEREAAKKIARDKAAREKLEQDAKEKRKRETQKQATPVRKPASMVEKKKGQIKQPGLKLDSRLLGWGGIILIGLALFGINALLRNQPVVSAPGQNTATFAATSTNIPSTSTLTPITESPTNTPPQKDLTPSPTMISEKDGMVLVYVSAGEFTMGSFSNPPVDLKAFWIDRTEVTNAMYAKCVAENKCASPDTSLYNNSKYTNHPVVWVSWNDALVYCSWAHRRLPTEAEWEKAARGTEAFRYPWGNEAPNSSLLNYNQIIRGTTEVGTYPDGASIYGALDMAGNVSEWVSSLYRPYPYDANDGREDLSSSGSRALRGGSWVEYSDPKVRSDNRAWSLPSDTYSILGFRCAVSHP
jgi:formylglycine-generating enzyme required for sulfatase activity